MVEIVYNVQIQATLANPDPVEILWKIKILWKIRSLLISYDVYKKIKM